MLRMKLFIIYFLTAFAVLISPIKSILAVMVMFIVFDTLFGIYGALKIHGISGFKSTKLFNIVVKSFFYLGSIILAFVVEKYIFEGKLLGIPLLLPKSMTMVWVYIEIKSMDETSMKLGNKSIWVLIKELVTKAKDLKQDLNDMTN